MNYIECTFLIFAVVIAGSYFAIPLVFQLAIAGAIYLFVQRSRSY